jgi:xylulokinase
VPEPAEYVADGAARQAAWVLSASAVPPAWGHAGVASYDAPYRPELRERYAAVRELTSTR